MQRLPKGSLMKSYKIALVSDWYFPRVGGIETHMCDLARRLRACGHEPHILTATSGLSDVGGIPVHRLPVPLVPNLGITFRPSDLVLLESLLRRERFDILHGHSLYSPLALGAMFLGRRLGVPSVLTSHSLVSGFARLLMRALDTTIGWATWPDVLTAVSSVAARQASDAAHHREVAVLHNGIDPQEWPSSGRHESSAVRITSVMRLYPRKRPQDLIQAIPLVLERLPKHIGPRFTIVGDGPLRTTVQRLGKQLGVLPWLELLGSRPRAEVREILGRSDLFVLPTMEEAFGIAVLEARCAGLPVVAMRHGGVRDLIDHGREGLLANSLTEFATHIARLVQDRALRQTMAQNTASGLERFSWDILVHRYLEIYRLAVDRQQQRCQHGAQC